MLVQVISLGAGKDSLYFRLMDKRKSPPGGYFEVDFEAVATWKKRVIAKTPVLSALTSGTLSLWLSLVVTHATVEIHILCYCTTVALC